jgi:hypothetical protein
MSLLHPRATHATSPVWPSLATRRSSSSLLHLTISMLLLATALWCLALPCCLLGYCTPLHACSVACRPSYPSHQGYYCRCRCLPLLFAAGVVLSQSSVSTLELGPTTIIVLPILVPDRTAPISCVATPELLSLHHPPRHRAIPWRPRVTPRRTMVWSATPSHRRATRAVFFAARAPPRRRPASGQVRPCFDLHELCIGPAHLSDHSGDPSITGLCCHHRFPSARAPPSWVTSSGEPPPWQIPQSSPPRHARAPSHLPDAPCHRQARASRAAASTATATPRPSALLLVWAGPEASSGPEPGQAGLASFGPQAQQCFSFSKDLSWIIYLGFKLLNSVEI